MRTTDRIFDWVVSRSKKRRVAGVLAAGVLAAAGAVHYFTVQPGDTLSGIAQQVCGSASGWQNIYQQNQGLISNPNLIYPGEQLKFQCSAAAVTSDLQQTPPVASVVQGAVSAPAGSFQACVISRESGGDPQAVNAASDAGGLYQFLPSTWAGLGYAAEYPGGAQTAPVSVQDAAFETLYAEDGTSPWAPSDGC